MKSRRSNKLNQVRQIVNEMEKINQITTFDRKLISFNNIFEAKISPKRTGTNSSEINKRNPHLLDNGNTETQNTIHNQTRHAPPQSSVAKRVGGLHEVPKLRSADFLQAKHDLHRPLADTWMIVRQPVGDGGDSETGVSRESRLDVGVAAETSVGVVGEEHGDVEVGEAEEFGEFEH